MAKVAEREKAAENRELLARNAEAAAEQQRRFWEAMRDAAEAERDQVAALRAEAERIKAEAERDHAAAKEEERATAARLASQTTQIATDRQRLNEREAQLSRFWQEFNEEEVALAADRESMAAAKRKAEEMQAYLAGVMPSARVFADAAAALKGVRVPQAVADAFQAARRLRSEALEVQTSSSLALQVRAIVTSGLLQASHSER
jgi:hypothetical protein